MTGENIICFAKDWTGDPTSVTHVMKRLAESNRVLWINSIATRAPDLSSGRDLSKIATKLVGFLKGPQRIHDNLWVYTPIVVPLPHSRSAVAINRWILRVAIGLLRSKLQMREFQLWVWPPTGGEYVDILGQSFTVYYCADAWSEFRGMDAQEMIRLDAHLCHRADIVFATGHALAEEKRKLNPNTYLASHGVAHQQFARALDPALPVPNDLAGCRQPVLGFYGLIEDWMDQDLVAYLAQRHPEWTIALLGKVCVDVSALKAYPNILFLGRKPHAELPAYCKQFAVGLLPHKINNLTTHMNPIKLREYLSAGLPVVATALPEVERYGDICTVTHSYAEFEQAVQTAIDADTPLLRRQRSEAMRLETWEHKVKRLMEIIAEIKSAQRAKSGDVGNHP